MCRCKEPAEDSKNELDNRDKIDRPNPGLSAVFLI